MSQYAFGTGTPVSLFGEGTRMKFGIVLAVVFSALVVVLVALTVLEIHDRSQPTLMHQLQDGTLGDLMAIAVVGVMGPLYAAWRSSSRDNHSRSVAHNNN